MSGIEFFEGPLRRVIFEPEGPVGVMLARAAVRVESAAKPLCPWDTGRLRSSIRWTPGAGEGWVVCVEVATSTGAGVTIGSDVEYAAYQELGTIYIEPRAYLRGGLQAVFPGADVVQQ